MGAIQERIEDNQEEMKTTVNVIQEKTVRKLRALTKTAHKKTVCDEGQRRNWKTATNFIQSKLLETIKIGWRTPWHLPTNGYKTFAKKLT